MATQDYPIFEITADFPERGSTTGRFEFKKATPEPTIRTGKLVDDRFSNVAGALGAVSGEGGRKDATVDVGGGRHLNRIRVTSLTGYDGQWGYTDDAGVTNAASASGGDRIQKAQVFNRYLLYASPDSFSPATLEYGEYAPGGFMPEGALDVFVEDPTWSLPRDESSSFVGELNFVSTIDLSNNPVTAFARTE